MSIPIWVNNYKHYSDIEKRIGLKLDSLLGYGAYGAVYSTNDPTLVVKITSDKNELILASKVTDIRRADTKEGLGPSDYLNGLVFIFGIYEAKPHFVFGNKIDLYVIVREIVEPIKLSTMLMYEAVKYDPYNTISEPELINIHRVLEKLHHEAAEFHRNNCNISNYDDIANYMNVLQELEPYSTSLYTTFRELVNHGIVMKDTHTGNIGMSIVDYGKNYRQHGELVVFDLGFTPTSHDYDLEICDI